MPDGCAGPVCVCVCACRRRGREPVSQGGRGEAPAAAALVLDGQAGTYRYIIPVRPAEREAWMPLSFGIKGSSHMVGESYWH